MSRKWGPKKGEFLPSGHALREEYIEKDEWQIWKTEAGSALCVSAALHQTWLETGLIEPSVFLPVSEDCFAAEDECFGLISSSAAGPYPRNGQEAMSIAAAFKKTRGMFGRISLSRSFYLPQMPYLLSYGEGDEDAEQDPWTLGRWLTGGMNIPFTDRKRILTWAPGMTDTLYDEILSLFGWEETQSQRIQAVPLAEEPVRVIREKNREKRKSGDFCLPGRPELEKFFRERIIDVIDREEEYRRMGVAFPGPTLLIGPPGCGKTYAVEKLTEYLGWPCFQVNSGSIGSKYVHETSKLISQLFQNAFEDAPSVVIMDEMEAYLSSRSEWSGGHQYHLEEMAEFLRILPQLPEKKVLLFGMTNMPDRIDPAIRRKGRFDHVLEVGMPSEKEIMDLLQSLLKDVPKEADLYLDPIARRLLSHPISDIAYVAKEAGRLCVVERRERIDRYILDRACDELEKEKENKQARRRIGF
ncbi:MAG: ATP-binding protein [Clostridia bacterium]|nr:ATP-binding protein [Clostridia bacterium]